MLPTAAVANNIIDGINKKKYIYKQKRNVIFTEKKKG